VSAVHKIVHVSIVAPLAGEHDMPALLPASPVLRRLASNYRSIVADVSLIIITILLRSVLGLPAIAAGTTYCMVAFALHFMLHTTLMRRKLLLELMKSFELGYVMIATLVMIAGEIILEFQPSASGSGFSTAQSYGWKIYMPICRLCRSLSSSSPRTCTR
jgi:hypothetical protein